MLICKQTSQKLSNLAPPSVTSTISSAPKTTTLETLSVKFIPRSWNSRILPSVQQRCITWTQKSFMETAAHLFTSACMTKEKTSTSRFGVNFPFMDSNISATPAYGVYTSQLVRYARIWTAKADFKHRLRSLSSRLKQQGFKSTLLVKSVKKFFKCHCTTMVKYHVTLRELLSAVRDWKISQLVDVSFPYL